MTNEEKHPRAHAEPEPEPTPATAADAPPADADTSAGQDEVAQRLHAEQERGFSGTVPDPTPNSAYTVGGVTAGEPTPETAPPEDEAPKARGE